MADFSKDTSLAETLDKLKLKKRKTEEDLRKIEEEKKKELAEAEDAITKIVAAEVQRKKQQEDEEELVKEVEELLDEKKPREYDLNLESMVQTAAPQPTDLPPRELPDLGYMSMKLREEQNGLYAITDYNVYTSLATIRNKVAQGQYISPQEQDFIEGVRSRTSQFAQDDEILASKDPLAYLRREEEMLHQIDNYVRLRKIV